ncbi:Hypothetical_protein [Hexamita inflata]|uniref:Hypothetical_protein n=1 Tax=Hexamita inflata TaxID=28002 RepID=A0AA86RL63_9EUKA|nr:Hypothetical protein HINF_LOCUS61689 [Hexamita inflata]
MTQNSILESVQEYICGDYNNGLSTDEYLGYIYEQNHDDVIAQIIITKIFTLKIIVANSAKDTSLLEDISRLLEILKQMNPIDLTLQTAVQQNLVKMYRVWSDLTSYFKQLNFHRTSHDIYFMKQQAIYKVNKFLKLHIYNIMIFTHIITYYQITTPIACSTISLYLPCDSYHLRFQGSNGAVNFQQQYTKM